MYLTPTIRNDRDTRTACRRRAPDAEYVADPANPVRPASTMNTVSRTLRQGEEQQRGHGLIEVTAACPGVEWRATADENGHYCFAVAL
jgi:hypothetical protein